MLVEENKLLAPFTTLGIGGPARWFVEAHSEEDIVRAAGWSEEKGIALVVLGGGSNLLVSDTGFEGLILHIAIKGVKVSEDPSDVSRRVYQVAAGENWDQFVERSVEDGCAGIECLAGIPGTVGGTPVQNVGAYGQEVSNTIERVRVFDLDKRDFIEFTALQCRFGYRQSRFNTSDKGRHIVSRVDFRLWYQGSPTLRYADLQRAFRPDSKPTLVETAEAVRHIRQAKGMLLVEGDPDCRSAGSFFKNPIVSEDEAERVRSAAGADPPRFPAGAENPGRVKLPAAWLIEKAGFRKGFVSGAAGISHKHTLSLVNRGGATAQEIIGLADQIRSSVALRFGIELEMEPVMLGF